MISDLYHFMSIIIINLSYEFDYEICKHVIGGSPTHNYRDVIRNALLKIAIPKTDEQCDSTSVSYDIHIEYNIFVNLFWQKLINMG